MKHCVKIQMGDQVPMFTWIKGEVLVGQLERDLGAKVRSHLDQDIPLGGVLNPEAAQRVETIEIHIVQDKPTWDVD